MRFAKRCERLERCAATGEGNLLECAVEAARKRATLGEISLALENVWGRYRSHDAHDLPACTQQQARTGGVQESAADGGGV